MASTVLGEVGAIDIVDFDAPLAPVPANAGAAGRKRKGCLGKMENGAPGDLHTLMEAAAARGDTPVTTLAPRMSARTSTTAEMGVPAELKDALVWGYINPVLPAPAGYRWRFSSQKWKLGLRGG